MAIQFLRREVKLTPEPRRESVAIVETKLECVLNSLRVCDVELADTDLLRGLDVSPPFYGRDVFVNTRKQYQRAAPVLLNQLNGLDRYVIDETAVERRRTADEGQRHEWWHAATGHERIVKLLWVLQSARCNEFRPKTKCPAKSRMHRMKHLLFDLIGPDADRCTENWR